MPTVNKLIIIKIRAPLIRTCFFLSGQKKKKIEKNEEKKTKCEINYQKIIEKWKKIQKMIQYMIEIGP